MIKKRNDYVSPSYSRRFYTHVRLARRSFRDFLLFAKQSMASLRDLGRYNVNCFFVAFCCFFFIYFRLIFATFAHRSLKKRRVSASLISSPFHQYDNLAKIKTIFTAEPEKTKKKTMRKVGDLYVFCLFLKSV